jgi:hypothetical protein
MKATKPQLYDTIETLPLYNFDKYRTTTDLNWFRVDYDGRQKKEPKESLQEVEKKLLDEYFTAIDDRSFVNRLKKLGEIEYLVTKYNVVKSLISRIWIGFGNEQMETRLLFIKELSKHGFKMSEINTLKGDQDELLRLNAGVEGIKTKINLLQKELQKDESKVSISLTKQLLIAQIGLQINRINPREISVLEWVEITKLLEEKSKQN